MKRPLNRAECVNGPRPCPWVSCRYHLFVDVNPRTGSLRYNFPGKELWELKYTCALDVAENGECSLERLGEVMNLTGERIRQLANAGLGEVRRNLEGESNGEVPVNVP